MAKQVSIKGSSGDVQDMANLLHGMLALIINKIALKLSQGAEEVEDETAAGTRLVADFR